MTDADALLSGLFGQALENDIGQPTISTEFISAVRSLRRNSQHRLALLLVEQALRTWNLSVQQLASSNPLPSIKSLSATQRAYLEDLVYEASLCAWYTEYRRFGLALSDLVLLDPNTSERSKKFVWSNVEYFVSPIPHTREWDVDVDLPFIKSDSEERYRPLNPSIVRDQDGYTIVCKSVNFDQLYGREYYVIDDDNYVRVRNFFIKTNKHLVRQRQYEITETLDRVRMSDHGLEDLRIARVNGSIWFTAFTRSLSESGNSLTVIGRLADVPDANNDLPVASIVLMEVPNNEIMEKNWLPFEEAGELRLTYSVGPDMAIIRPETSTGANETLVWNNSPFDLHRFRGSGGPVPLTHNGVHGTLYVVHEVVYKEYKEDTTSRTYFHRFVFVNSNFEVSHLSRLFVFADIGVEFCTSIVLSHEPGMLLLSVGLEDRQAKIYEMPLAQVSALLFEPMLLY